MGFRARVASSGSYIRLGAVAVSFVAGQARSCVPACLVGVMHRNWVLVAHQRRIKDWHVRVGSTGRATKPCSPEIHHMSQRMESPRISAGLRNIRNTAAEDKEAVGHTSLQGRPQAILPLQLNSRKIHPCVPPQQRHTQTHARTHTHNHTDTEIYNYTPIDKSKSELMPALPAL